MGSPFLFTQFLVVRSLATNMIGVRTPLLSIHSFKFTCTFSFHIPSSLNVTNGSLNKFTHDLTMASCAAECRDKPAHDLRSKTFMTLLRSFFLLIKIKSVLLIWQI
ncbi:hypothetical protein VVNSV5830_01864 [Vibrio vulnificus]|nr:hypothetical protein VVORL1506_00381 [Vibrio vulnificus]OJI26602.1 hypothetical protein VVNSV5830_01864 [Vibrio vulnificus]